MSRLSFKQYVKQQQHYKHYDLHEHEVEHDIHTDTCGFKHANYFKNSINLCDQGFHICSKFKLKSQIRHEISQ